MDEKYSFVDLFRKPVDLNKEEKVTINQIVIPMIQRPYAQGRKDKACGEIREKFLSEIFDALCNDKSLELNFVYGIVRSANASYVMELLDGQQRLTTLFLLYWYIANRELSEGDATDREVCGYLKNFIYETRSTSTVFCRTLADYRTDLSGKKTPQEIIRSSKWYFKSFDKDSTVVAMLNMLDAIHEKYNQSDAGNLYPRLQSIQFYVKSLGYFNLSEELYIKMNARGLQLSVFENFKADLTDFITHSSYGDYSTSVPLFNNDGEQVPFYLNFSTELDAKWVDIFWNGKDSRFDAAYMNFFRRYFACKYIVDSVGKVSGEDMRTDETIKNLYTDGERHIADSQYGGFAVYRGLLEEHPEYVCSLALVLDIFYDRYLSDIQGSLVPVWDRSDSAAFDDFYCNPEATMSQTKLIIFSAIIEYIEAYRSFDRETFRKWMRIVWNIVENTNIDSLAPVTLLARKLAVMIRYAAQSSQSDLYAALVAWADEKSEEREGRAVWEEIEKARRIVENPAWEATFIAVERHPFFKGMVLFFYTPGMLLEAYLHRSELISQMFDARGISEEYRKDHLLIRAIVSRLNAWDDDNLRERYITERAEANKYLKNILAAHKGVREMLADAADRFDMLGVKEKLQGYIMKEDEFIYWSDNTENKEKATDLAVQKLRHNVRMYDWIENREKLRGGCFRVYYYKGHIMFAVPNRQYDRIVLDTDRAIVAKKIIDNYGFNFGDSEQKRMYDDYGECFDKEFWLMQERKNCRLWIGFMPYHEVRFQIEYTSEDVAKQMKKKIENSTLDSDPTLLWLPSEKHFLEEDTYPVLARRIEEIFSIVPPLEVEGTELES